MKALIIIFLILVVLAIGIALAAVYFLADSVPAPLAGSRVLAIRLDQPLLDYSPVPHVPFFELEPPLSMATLFRALDRAFHGQQSMGLVGEAVGGLI